MRRRGGQCQIVAPRLPPPPLPSRPLLPSSLVLVLSEPPLPHAVTGLPTLVAYDREGGEVGRVGGELERAADENAARAVVEAWVSGLKAG